MQAAVASWSASIMQAAGVPVLCRQLECQYYAGSWSASIMQAAGVPVLCSASINILQAQAS